jgi:hypothetical protein
METQQMSIDDNNTQKLEPQAQNTITQPISTTQKTNLNLTQALLIVLICLAIFGVGGFLLGKLYNNPAKDIESTQQNPPNQAATAMSTPIPTTTVAINPLKPNLASMTNWKTVSFPQNVVASQGGDSVSAKVEFNIPPTWTAEVIKAKTEEQIGGVICKDIQVSSQNKQSILVIRPDCGGSSPDYLTPDDSLQVVELTTKKGNDGHDSYTVRYSNNTSYKYGEIGILPGSKIDLSKDKIYPIVILQFEPDKYEQWLFTSIDMFYSGIETNRQIALSMADSIVSTLRLAD